MKKFLSLCLMCSLVSCQDRKNLLNLLFPSTLAIDYQNGQYEIALQIDNLNALAKKELETSSEEAKLLVATAKGNTIEEAILNIEENQRSIINLSHVKSIILRPNALNLKQLTQIINFASFHAELRKDCEVFYTTCSLKDLFTTSFQLSRSELFILINSSEFQRTGLSIGTIHIMEVAKAIKEKNITIKIPVLSISHNKDLYINQNDTTQQNVFEINHLLFYKSGKAIKLSLKDLKGLQWVSSSSNNIEINISENNDELSCYASRVTAFSYYSNKDDAYHIKGKINMVVLRDSQFRSLETLEPLIKEKVHEQIMHTYNTGLQHHVDVYNLEYKSILLKTDKSRTQPPLKLDLDVSLHLKGSYVGSY